MYCFCFSIFIKVIFFNNKKLCEDNGGILRYDKYDRNVFLLFGEVKIFLFWNIIVGLKDGFDGFGNSRNVFEVW